MGMHVCVCLWWEVGHRWDYTIVCSFLSPLHAPLFLSRGSLQRGALLCLVPSLIQHSWAASFQLVASVSWFRGLWGAGEGV